ncbi:DUF2635 domain-containing protein [Lichenihabitans sp. PAMC28606]|uniref:DUF2635 domain-containing protein n=1 Tax=Lichenihabitans sp. PAMC28606 TaxID=2880932 RepID=UPI001D0ABC6E|nr:DUF2635 domain-containing protein [Lichenihabitans sp. PAMC28606]UDL95504.1 DUF2635 domain-containing protein [Lichenihabitans sp. PAMC28606]
MTDAPVRKIVKPAHVGACIPDPAHATDLPRGGSEVVWDHYWMGRLARGEIVVVEPEARVLAPVAAPPSKPTA